MMDETLWPETRYLCNCEECIALDWDHDLVNEERLLAAAKVKAFDAELRTDWGRK